MNRIPLAMGFVFIFYILIFIILILIILALIKYLNYISFN